MVTNKIKLVVYKCSKCNAEVGFEDKYCRMCGVKFDEDEINDAKHIQSTSEVESKGVSELSPLIEK